MFKIIKKGSNNFWHVYNNGAKNVSISDFEVVLDSVLNTFVIVLRNGANIPQIVLKVEDIIVIDETDSSIEETYLTAEQLRNRLKQLNYTPYIVSGTAELSQLTDVDVTGLVNGQVLVWNSDTNKWVSTTIGGISTPTLQEVTDAGNETTNSITANAFYKVIDGNTYGIDEDGSLIYNGSESFYDPSTGKKLYKQGFFTADRTRAEPDKDGTYAMTSDIPTTATDLDALKRNGSNANSDVDIATGGYSLKTKKVFIGSPTTQMEVNSENLTDNRVAQWQNKDYSGIADITDIPTSLSSLTDDSTHRLVTDSEKSTWNGKQNALGYTAENISNKSDSYTASSSTTYATTKALVDGLATKQDKMSWISSSTPFTGTSSTALQKISNAGSSGNGSFSAKANTRYKIEIQFIVSGLSSSNNSIQFGILGTAGITSVNGISLATKSVTLSSSGTTISVGINSASISGNLTTIGTQSFARAKIEVEVVTSTAGTLIMAYATNVSTTPVIESHTIRFIELGASSSTSSSDIV